MLCGSNESYVCETTASRHAEHHGTPFPPIPLSCHFRLSVCIWACVRVSVCLCVPVCAFPPSCAPSQPHTLLINCRHMLPCTRIHHYRYKPAGHLDKPSCWSGLPRIGSVRKALADLVKRANENKLNEIFIGYSGTTSANINL